MKVVQRAVLIKCMYEVWGKGMDFEEVAAGVKAFPEKHMTKHLTVCWNYSTDIYSALPQYKRVNSRRVVRTLDLQVWDSPNLSFLNDIKTQTQK